MIHRGNLWVVCAISILAGLVLFFLPPQAPSASELDYPAKALAARKHGDDAIASCESRVWDKPFVYTQTQSAQFAYDEAARWESMADGREAERLAPAHLRAQIAMVIEVMAASIAIGLFVFRPELALPSEK